MPHWASPAAQDWGPAKVVAASVLAPSQQLLKQAKSKPYHLRLQA